MSSIKKSQFHYTQILYFSINIFPVPIFCIKILLILPKLHEKTLSCFGIIKLFSQSFWRYQSFFLECSEWEFSGWGFSGGNSPGGGGVWWVEIFRVVILSGGIFLEPSRRKRSEWVQIYCTLKALAKNYGVYSDLTKCLCPVPHIFFKYERHNHLGCQMMGEVSLET